MKALEIVQGAQGASLDVQAKIKNIPPIGNPVDHFANIVNLLNAEIKILKSKEALLAQERKTLEGLISKAEKTVFEEMKNEGLVELGGGLVKYVIKLNPHKLIIDDESLIPNEFKTPVTAFEIKKDAIKEELKMGSEIPGCRLVQDQSLQLKTNS